MFDSNFTMSEARRFLFAVGGALLFSLACLAAAIGPAKADCLCVGPVASLDRPTLL